MELHHRTPRLDLREFRRPGSVVPGGSWAGGADVADPGAVSIVTA